MTVEQVCPLLRVYTMTTVTACNHDNVAALLRVCIHDGADNVVHFGADRRLFNFKGTATFCSFTKIINTSATRH